MTDTKNILIVCITIILIVLIIVGSMVYYSQHRSNYARCLSKCDNLYSNNGAYNEVKVNCIANCNSFCNEKESSK